MKKMIRLIIYMTILLGMALPVFASDIDESAKADEWMTLSPDEKAVLRKQFKIWKSLSESQKETILNNYRTYKSLPDIEKQRIKKNFSQFKSG